MINLLVFYLSYTVLSIITGIFTIIYFSFVKRPIKLIKLGFIKLFKVDYKDFLLQFGLIPSGGIVEFHDYEYYNNHKSHYLQDVATNSIFQLFLWFIIILVSQLDISQIQSIFSFFFFQSSYDHLLVEIGGFSPINSLMFLLPTLAISMILLVLQPIGQQENKLTFIVQSVTSIYSLVYFTRIIYGMVF